MTLTCLGKPGHERPPRARLRLLCIWPKLAQVPRALAPATVLRGFRALSGPGKGCTWDWHACRQEALQLSFVERVPFRPALVPDLVGALNLKPSVSLVRPPKYRCPASTSPRRSWYHNIVLTTRFRYPESDGAVSIQSKDRQPRTGSFPRLSGRWDRLDSPARSCLCHRHPLRSTESRRLGNIALFTHS